MSNEPQPQGHDGSHSKPFDLIVNKQHKTWPAQFITGAQIKQVAGSPQDWVVNQLVPGAGEDPEIGDQQQVDLAHDSAPKGVKRFTTRKPTTTPGRATFLPADDREYLSSKGLAFEEASEAVADGTVRRAVILKGFPCDGLFSRSGDSIQPLAKQATCSVAILVPNGYATTKLDSFYTIPRLCRADGSEPPSTGSADLFGQSWQFWSRHLADADWRPGLDGLETYLQYVRNELKKA